MNTLQWQGKNNLDVAEIHKKVARLTMSVFAQGPLHLRKEELEGSLPRTSVKATGDKSKDRACGRARVRAYSSCLGSLSRQSSSVDMLKLGCKATSRMVRQESDVVGQPQTPMSQKHYCASVSQKAAKNASK